MKKYLVIGNPIQHSLSPKLHNHWIKENKINATYDKKQLNNNDIEEIIREVKKEKIDGINVTVPFKKSVIPFLDQLTPLAKEAQSVNTIFKKDNKVVGDNTDIGGFEQQQPRGAAVEDRRQAAGDVDKRRRRIRRGNRHASRLFKGEGALASNINNSNDI